MYLVWKDKLTEYLCIRLAWKLPRRLVYWCALRVAANATTGDYGNTEVPSLSALDMLRRWETIL